MYIGQSSAWISIASILYTFDLSPTAGESVPLGEFDEASIVRYALSSMCYDLS